MSKHAELIERLRYFDRLACNDAIGVIEAQEREIEALRKDAERAKQLEQLARWMFDADNDHGTGFYNAPNWRLWYTRLADFVGVKLESMP